MKISSSINTLGNINSLFNTLAQGKSMMIANKLSNSKFLFPENVAPGKGTMSNDTVSYINDLKEASSDLSAAVKDLQNSFNQKGLESSNSDALTAKLTGSGFSYSNVGEMKIKIDQVAKEAVYDKDGNLVSEAQDAIYSVNGGPKRTSSSNDVYLGNGVTATLKEASDKEVTIKPTTVTDKEKAIGAIKDMVGSYNNLFSAAAGQTGDPKAQGLASRMLNVTGVYSKQLSDIGIGFDASGKMTVDEKKLGEAADSGALDKLFGQDAGRNYGFTNQLGNIASSVQNNTSAFVTNSVFGTATDIFGYNNSGNSNRFNVLNTGSIFDYLF